VTRIGTRKHPAVIRVQTTQRAEQVMALCTKQGVECIVGVEPDQPEDLSDIERALNPSGPVRVAPKPGRNAACPCGSGVKTKKCCPELTA
jgi:SWIM/SEC-C metal-binding protein